MGERDEHAGDQAELIRRALHQREDGEQREDHGAAGGEGAPGQARGQRAAEPCEQQQLGRAVEQHGPGNRGGRRIQQSEQRHIGKEAGDAGDLVAVPAIGLVRDVPGDGEGKQRVRVHGLADQMRRVEHHGRAEQRAEGNRGVGEKRGWAGHTGGVTKPFHPALQVAI